MCLKKVNVVNQQCIVCNLYLNVTCIIEAGAGWWQHFWWCFSHRKVLFSIHCVMWWIAPSRMALHQALQSSAILSKLSAGMLRLLKSFTVSANCSKGQSGFRKYCLSWQYKAAFGRHLSFMRKWPSYCRHHFCNILDKVGISAGKDLDGSHLVTPVNAENLAYTAHVDWKLFSFLSWLAYFGQALVV